MFFMCSCEDANSEQNIQKQIKKILREESEVIEVLGTGELKESMLL